jgi:hypothetical protein
MEFFIDALLTPWGFKWESQIENIGKMSSRGTLHGSQHYRGVEGACWSSEMGLGRSDRLYSLTRTCTKPTPSGKSIVITVLVLGRGMRNSNTQDSSWPGLGGSHHLPPYNVLCASQGGSHPNGFFSWDSQVGVSKLQQFGLPWLWGRITSCSDMWSQWGLKQICSPCWELSNAMLHATWTKGNLVDSRLLLVGSQTANLTPDLSFGHNFCFRCPNGECEPILNIYTSIDF